jgi:hypothetical protein
MWRGSSLGGWDANRDGQTFGPVAAGGRREVRAAEQVRPRQALWQQVGPSLIFVPPATAAGPAPSLDGAGRAGP